VLEEGRGQVVSPYFDTCVGAEEDEHLMNSTRHCGGAYDYIHDIND
jgi:hypothetical protein